MCCSAPFRLSVSFQPSAHVAHVDKCFKSSHGEKTQRRQQAALVTAVAPTLWSVWWCPLAGWGCPVHPRQKWQCSRSYLPPYMSAPRVHLLSSSLALTGKKEATSTKLKPRTLPATLWSATSPLVPLRKQTSWRHACSVHAVGANYLPISSTMKTIFKFFDPGFTSLIKTKVSVVVLAIVNF